MSRFDLRFYLSGTLRKDWPHWIVSLPSELQRSQSELAGWNHAHTLFKYMKKNGGSLWKCLFISRMNESSLGCSVTSDQRLQISTSSCRFVTDAWCFQLALRSKCDNMPKNLICCRGSKRHLPPRQLRGMGRTNSDHSPTPAVVPVDLLAHFKESHVFNFAVFKSSQKICEANQFFFIHACVYVLK